MARAWLPLAPSAYPKHLCDFVPLSHLQENPVPPSQAQESAKFTPPSPAQPSPGFLQSRGRWHRARNCTRGECASGRARGAGVGSSRSRAWGGGNCTLQVKLQGQVGRIQAMPSGGGTQQRRCTPPTVVEALGEGGEAWSDLAAGPAKGGDPRPFPRGPCPGFPKTTCWALSGQSPRTPSSGAGCCFQAPGAGVRAPSPSSWQGQVRAVAISGGVTSPVKVTSAPET